MWMGKIKYRYILAVFNIVLNDAATRNFSFLAAKTSIYFLFQLFLCGRGIILCTSSLKLSASNCFNSPKHHIFRVI